MMCLALALTLTPPVFLHYFRTCLNAKKGYASLISVNKKWLFTLFNASFNVFKTRYLKVGLTNVGRSQFYEKVDRPKFSIYLMENNGKITSWHKTTTTPKELEVVEIIDHVSCCLPS